MRNESEKAAEVNTKLPKFTITPFKGTLLDWQRFWNQFTVEIDSKENAVTKMSYLRELIEPKVQVLINGLPFTIKGYTRAKTRFSVENLDDQVKSQTHMFKQF